MLNGCLYTYISVDRMLGQWEDAYHDLTKAAKLDYDDDINEMLTQVKPNVSKSCLV